MLSVEYYLLLHDACGGGERLEDLAIGHVDVIAVARVHLEERKGGEREGKGRERGDGEEGE